MDLEFGAEDQLVIQSVLQFAERYLAQGQFGGETGDIAHRIRSEIADLGLWGMCIDSSRHGLGFSRVTGVAVVATLASYSASVGLVVGQHALVCAGLAHWGGSDGTLGTLATLLARGTTSYCHVDASRCVLSSVSPSHEVVRLSGTVPLVPGAAHAGGLLVTFPSGMALLSSDTPGITVLPHITLGLCSAGWATVTFDNVTVCVEADCLGNKFANLAYEQQLLVDAAVAVGIAQGALQVSVAYAQDRHQFGKPISDFQAIQWKIADSAVDVEAARSLLFRAAAEVDGTRRLAYAAMAARYSRTVASGITRHGMQIHGGYGYTTDYVIERLFRDAHHLEGVAEPNHSDILPVISAVYGRTRDGLS
ncbi:MAG: acyl-CoA/acyl-ACP dehydrogenase [Myxococcales bacterium]|nr:acyl-CoA/acyl-ACP dehydrogenase [Myxococcales bacterium]